MLWTYQDYVLIRVDNNHKYRHEMIALVGM
jgi:hypothetical protein